jgi:hypothetical protein
MKRAIIMAVTAVLALGLSSLAFAAGPAALLAGAGKPPAELLSLEREVSLKMAHARDEGFTEPTQVKTLADAEAVDTAGEKALKDGEYERAENDFLQAKVLLHNLGI